MSPNGSGLSNGTAVMINMNVLKMKRLGSVSRGR